MAIFRFHQNAMTSHSKTVEWAAHDIANLPQSLVNMLSQYFTVMWPNVPYCIGMPALTVAAMYLLVPGTSAALRPLQTRMLWVCFGGYFIIVLATLGTYTVVSDLVFYFIPQIGEMHSYQRFIFPGQFLFAVATAWMCQAIFEIKPTRIAKFVLVAAVIAMFVLAYLLTVKPELAKSGLLTQYLIIDALLTALLAIALLAPGKHSLAILAWVVFAAPSLDRFYDLVTSRHSLAVQRESKPIALDDRLQAEFIAYLQRTFPNRAELKYFDTTPMWRPDGHAEWFPKNFPGFVIESIRLTSFGGYPSHINARRDYAAKMPVLADGGSEDTQPGNRSVTPDWEAIQAAGAAFFIAKEDELRSGAAGAALSTYFSKARPESLFRLPAGLVAVPFPDAASGTQGNHVLFEISAFRAISTTMSPQTNLALGRPARQSSGIAAPASRAVDGNTSGDFASQSVTHTDADVNAWLEIDLGAIKAIGSVHVWNRTDCCGERLRDYWVFVSEVPFGPKYRAADLKGRRGVLAFPGSAPNPMARISVGGAKGRYVRVQLSGNGDTRDSFLSVAEVEVIAAETGAPAASQKFERESSAFNFANRASLSFETSSTTAIQYRYSFNDGLAFTVDGQQVKPQERDGLPTLLVGPGRHTVEVRYSRPLLTAFWTLYAVLIAAAISAWILGRTGLLRPLPDVGRNWAAPR